MKALSVRAPWWWAILHGKPVENRDWPTNVRGRILLHASKWWSNDSCIWDWDAMARMAEKDEINIPFPGWTVLHDSGGCLVGSVDLVDCVTSHPSAFFVGRYGFVLRDPVIFAQPIPFKGKLGFFEVPDEVERLEGEILNYREALRGLNRDYQGVRGDYCECGRER